MNDVERTREQSGELDRLIARQQPGHPLTGEFYRSPEVYERDLERVVWPGWIVAAHASELAEPGDYLLLDIDRESVIVTRDQEGEVRALVNVCRHRGSRVCVERRGRLHAFVCPYHGWSYALDGRLRSRRHMPCGFDRAAHGLKRLRAAVFHGLVFVTFDEWAPALEPALAPLSPPLEPYALEATRVAAMRTYSVDANWKLVVENFMECYHCAPAHPEYSRLHTLKAPPEDTAELRARMLARAETLGYPTAAVDRLPPAGAGVPLFHNRHALYPGHVSGTEDGGPAAPLLGRFEDYDGGAADLQLGPLTFMLIYPDHAVVYRFVPRAPERTDMDVFWLVEARAQAGRDYDPGRLTWLWHVTSEADKRIIDLNQQGVRSRFYEPGPYSRMERYADRFIRWYLDAIA